MVAGKRRAEIPIVGVDKSFKDRVKGVRDTERMQQIIKKVDTKNEEDLNEGENERGRTMLGENNGYICAE